MQTQSWLDYLVAISTALAAFGTLAAVVLALYLNVWRERHSKPKLSLEEFEDTWFGVGFDPGKPTPESVWGVPLIVRNAVGAAPRTMSRYLRLSVFESAMTKLGLTTSWISRLCGSLQPFPHRGTGLPPSIFLPGLAGRSLSPSSVRRISSIKRYGLARLCQVALPMTLGRKSRMTIQAGPPQFRPRLQVSWPPIPLGRQTHFGSGEIRSTA